MSAQKVSFEQLVAELQRRGILLEADAVLPSVARMVIGGPWPGSWWAHPLCHRVYMLCQELLDYPDVIVIRLVMGKMAYVHRRVWSDLYAVASAREAWQTGGLPDSARALLAEVMEHGRVRTDELRARRGRKSLGGEARTLEARLLIFGAEVHTDRGAHAKALEAWQHWAARIGFKPAPVSATAARARFEQLVAELNSRSPGRAFMPWSKPAKRGARKRFERPRD
jgi:hypothetical protein